MSISLRNAVLRAVPGAFILNAGIGKLNLPEEAAESLQSMAVKGVPALEKLTPAQFGKFLSAGEIAVGAALLTPLVPNRVAGAALGAFSGSLLSMYFNTPEMTEDDGIRPTQDGTPIAKDSWLAAIAVVLLLGGARGR